MRSFRLIQLNGCTLLNQDISVVKVEHASKWVFNWLNVPRHPNNVDDMGCVFRQCHRRPIHIPFWRPNRLKLLSAITVCTLDIDDGNTTGNSSKSGILSCRWVKTILLYIYMPLFWCKYVQIIIRTYNTTDSNSVFDYVKYGYSTSPKYDVKYDFTSFKTR